MKIPIDRVQPGMVVAADVTNLNNIVLLAAGTEVTAGHLRALRMWGIDTIPVDGQAKDAGLDGVEDSVAAEIFKAAEAHVNRRMKHVPASHAVVGQVKELAVQRLARRLATEQKKKANAA